MIKIIIASVATFMLFAGAHAHAKAAIDTDKNPNVFKADGKIVSPVDAMQLAKDHEIERCTPIKGATDVNGKDAVAYKCKGVTLVFNPKTGVPHWKAN